MDLMTFVQTLEPHVFRALASAVGERLQEHIAAVPVLTDAERELVGLNHRIHAIKCVCKRTGLGLKEAKDIVDNEVPRAEPQVTIAPKRPLRSYCCCALL